MYLKNMFSYFFNNSSEEIQYLGTCYTHDCLKAITFILQTQPHIEKALLLSNNGFHAFLIISEQNTYVIRSGFSSGYLGEGTKGLASALQLLLKHHVEIEEINISSKLMKKLNKASLSSTDVENISNYRYILPIQIYEYIYAIYENLDYQKNNNRYYSSELPYHLIDSRIFDLALKFKEDPNSAIMSAYTRLEDIVRLKTNSEKFSVGLLEQAFCSDKKSISQFKWDVENEEASTATGRLFTNIFKSFRNERAHSEVNKQDLHCFREFLLINELYLLESEAIQRIE